MSSAKQHRSKTNTRQTAFSQRATTCGAFLKNQVTNALDETHIISLNEDHVGHANTTIPHLLTFSHKHCGAITENYLMENNTNISKEWDPNTPMQTLCFQIESGCKHSKLAGMSILDEEKSQPDTSQCIKPSSSIMLVDVGGETQKCKKNLGPI